MNPLKSKEHTQLDTLLLTLPRPEDLTEQEIAQVFNLAFQNAKKDSVVITRFKVGFLYCEFGQPIRDVEQHKAQDKWIERIRTFDNNRICGAITEIKPLITGDKILVMGTIVSYGPYGDRIHLDFHDQYRLSHRAMKKHDEEITLFNWHELVYSWDVTIREHNDELDTMPVMWATWEVDSEHSVVDTDLHPAILGKWVTVNPDGDGDQVMVVVKTINFDDLKNIIEYEWPEVNTNKIKWWYAQDPNNVYLPATPTPYWSIARILAAGLIPTMPTG